MGDNKDAVIMIAIIIGLGIAWAVAGGPARVERERGIEGPATQRSQERTYESLSSTKGAGAVAGDSIDEPGDIARELDKVEQELLRVQEELDYIKEHGERSPYEEKVTISKTLSGARQENPSREYLIINSKSTNDERIIITGWKIESSITGRAATIPAGTPLPASGSVNSASSIVLEPGDRAYLTTGRSPIGTSFRTNLCTGYFEQFQDFYPSLRRSCPDPDDELEDFGSGVPVTDDACYDYVRRLSRCSLVINSPPLSVTNACWNFVTKNINYSGCVANHRGDDTFFSSEWRIFLGHTEELWRERREVIKLLDEKGRLVDTLTY